jgi:hypothetical protein
MGLTAVPAPGTIDAMTTAMHRFRCPPARRGLAGAFGMA